MNLFKIFVLSILLFSCSEDKELNLHKRWFDTFEIKKSKNFEWGALVLKPENTKFELFEVKHYKVNSFEIQQDCIFIKTPFKRTMGELFIAQKERPTCHEQLHKKMLRVLEFKEIKFFLSKNVLVIKADETIMNIKLYNYNPTQNAFMEVYGPNVDLGYLSSGVNERPLILKSSNNFLEKTFFIKKQKDILIKDTPFKVTNKKCHSLDGKCRSKKEFTCDECPNGYVEVVGGLCLSGGDKYCAPLDCGGIGQIACYRGSKHTLGPKKLACQNESVEGICQFGLQTYCQDDILFCR